MMATCRRHQDALLFVFANVVFIAAWAKFSLPPFELYLTDYVSRTIIVATVLMTIGLSVLRPPQSFDARVVAAVFGVVGITLLVRHFVVLELPYSGWTFGWSFPRISDPALRWGDAVFGLALVAIHEEIVYRHLPTRLERAYGWHRHLTYAFSIVTFAAIHAPQGLAKMTVAIGFAIVAMPLYRRFGSLWFPIAAHFLVDFILFSDVGCWIGIRIC